MLVVGFQLHPDGSFLEWAYSRTATEVRIATMTVAVTALQAPRGMTITLKNIDESISFATGLNQIEDILAYLATVESGSRGVGGLYFATKNGASLKYVALNALD
jgi:hypothetical protein